MISLTIHFYYYYACLWIYVNRWHCTLTLGNHRMSWHCGRIKRCVYMWAVPYVVALEIHKSGE